MQVDAFWALAFGALDLFRIWSFEFSACLIVCRTILPSNSVPLRDCLMGCNELELI